MVLIRPKTLVRYGRQNEPIRVPIYDLLVDSFRTYITADTVSGSSSLTVENITSFAVNQVLLIGNPGNEGSEIVKTHASTAPVGAVITLASSTTLPHSAGTYVYVINFDQVEYSNATTLTGTKSILTQIALVADNDTTNYNDTLNSTGYYFARFINSIGATFTISGATLTSSAHGLSNGQLLKLTAVTTMPTGLTSASLYYVVGATTNTFQVSLTLGGSAVTSSDSGAGTLTWFRSSPYSDGSPITGYTIYTARAVIDSALSMINQKTSEILSDEFAFREIDNCQQECVRELKRWSWLQSFDTIIGSSSTGNWKVAVPTDLDDQNTNKSIYNFKLGKNQNLIWVDKEKWNELIEFVAHTTLANNIALNDVTITLTDSGDFDDSGVAQIGANMYTYTANNRTTNVLTITASTTTNTAGEDAFQGATLGLPQYWTTFGGYLYHYPVCDVTNTNRNYYLDYYKRILTITTDSDTLVITDPTIAQYFLAWKFLLKLNNGVDSPETDAKFQNYIARREKMKQKESMNRTFVLRPRINDWASRMSGYGSGDGQRIRDGNFPNI